MGAYDTKHCIAMCGEGDHAAHQGTWACDPSQPIPVLGRAREPDEQWPGSCHASMTLTTPPGASCVIRLRAVILILFPFRL